MSEEKKKTKQSRDEDTLSDEELDGVAGGAKNFNSSKSNTSAVGTDDKRDRKEEERG